MNEDDRNLRLYTIYFLDELDTKEGSARYYRKELIRRYKSFCARNPAASRYKFRDVLGYMLGKKYGYSTKYQVVLKPMFIHLEERKPLLFTINPGLECSSEYFVCQVCDRGFATHHSLMSHQSSAYHNKQLKVLLEFVKEDNFCPLLNCEFRGRSRNDVRRHLREEKYIKVKRDVSIEDSTIEKCKERNAYCELCGIKCTSEYSLQQHQLGKKHRTNELTDFYRTERQNLLQNKGRIEVTIEQNPLVEDEDVGAVLHMTGGLDKKVEVKIKVANKAEPVELITFKHLYIYDTHTVSLVDRAAVSQGGTHSIQKGGRYTVKVVITPTHFGKLTIPVLFTLRRSGEEYKIVRELVYRCVPDAEVFAEIQPVSPFVQPKTKKPEALEIVPSNVKATIDSKMQLESDIPLGQYRLGAKVKDQLEYVENAPNSAEADERWNETRKELGIDTLSQRNYPRYFHSLLHVEEQQMEVDIAQYAMEEVQLRKDTRSNYVTIKIPGLAENRPSVLKGDKLYVTKTPPDGKQYEGVVQQVELESIKVEFDSKLTDKIIDKMKFGVQFTINRFSLRLEHRAVSSEMFRKVSSVLFPSPQRQQPLASRFRFFSRKVEDNLEQNTAVKHILSGTSMEAPYLIYGPPGTGKTSTLVEAIKQVWSCKPGCRILVCAPQNAAADLLTERLLVHVDKKDILRLNAPSRSYEDIQSQKVQAVSNYVEDSSGASRAGGRRLYGPVAVSSKMKVEFPSREVLMQHKILVSTLVTSGRLVSADMRNHFTHIFIDEAGHATEPETVIPLSGLLGGGSNVQVVLAGDPKQLGPVIRSPAAIPLGKSLLERLMNCDLHRQDPVTGSFNPDYVTKLVRSFRSHPDILEVPNACFYDDELIAQADKMQRERFCNWEGLPKRGFPLIFHGMNADDHREGKSPSWFNPGEATTVVNYVKLLMECKNPHVTANDIGIISPYHQQVNKIMKGLKALELSTRERTRNYDKIAVGSVEKFQGSEKEVIIISTVRSQDAFVVADKKFNLGFIYNPKRFNVAVTRAKALLIVVGNPSILRRSPDWLRLMNHIEEGGGYVGVPPPDEVDSDELTEVTDMMKAVEIKEALASGASEYQQQGNPEWRRKE